MGYDVAGIRQNFPALADGAAHFDGPGGSQVPTQVGAAIAATVTAAIANRGTGTAAERRADAVVVGARQAVADLLGADPRGVVFGRSMTALTYDFARTLAKTWGPGDEVVVTRLDHDANIRPWVTAAATVGATVRWVDFDPRIGELLLGEFQAVLSERTRLVALTGASNLTGHRPPVPVITKAVHAVGALAYVDGVHLTPHVPVDVAELGADFYACSPYKFLGPHLGVVAAAPALLETLRPDKLLPQTDAVPERFELGTLPYELLAGTTAAIDFFADLQFGVGPSGPAPRRRRLRRAFDQIFMYERELHRRLETELRALPGVTLYSKAGPDRTPTTLFSVAGHEPKEVSAALAAAGVNAPAGSFYALEASRRMGLGAAGAVRAGLAPYTNDDDVDRLVAGVAALAR